MTNHPNRSKQQRGARCIYREMTARELDRAIDTQTELLAALKELVGRSYDALSAYNIQDQRALQNAHEAIAKAEGRT